MAAIKIPSSNIYKIAVGQTAQKNKIERASLSVDKFILKEGNVLKKEYTINYFETKFESDDAFIYSFVGNDPSKNEFLFDMHNDHFAVPRDEPFNFEIGELTKLTLNNDGYAQGYTVIRERHWRGLTDDNQYEEATETQTYSYKTAKLSYNAEKNSFNFDVANELLSTDNVKGVLVKFSNRYLMYEVITIEGTYYSRDDVLIERGSSTKGNEIELPTNELMQVGSMVDTSELGDFLVTSVLNRYGAGKEVYELKCSIAEYYDTDQMLAISPTDVLYHAMFKKHDIVEPYIFTSEGEVPLSVKSDGTPKQFEIIGIDYSYQGVVWQELTIQEYVN